MGVTIIESSDFEIKLPDPRHAPADSPIAYGGQLTTARLIEAYTKGIFPWYENDASPILWWSPDPRALIKISDFKPSRSLRRKIKSNYFNFSVDTVFEDVITNCQHIPRNGSRKTWITPKMKRAYCKLHQKGYAHSFETWLNSDLVGGLYGISLGNWFFGESMFSLRSDASKAALFVMIRQLKEWGFEWIDCQVMNPHLYSLGARGIRRTAYLDLLAQNKISQTRNFKWMLV